MTGAAGVLNPHKEVYVSKWVTFASCALLEACAGLAYSFSVYAPTIKDSLDLTQTQVATVGSAVNLGGYFAIVSGAIYDSLKDYHKLGPRLVVALGSLCCVCGYLGMYLMVSGLAPKNFVQLLIFAAAAGNMGVWYDTSSLVTCVRNFPNDRGFVVGVLKSFLGLSSSLFTSIYACAFEPDATRYLLMLALVPSSLGLLLSLGMNYVPFVETSEVAHPNSRWSARSRFQTAFLMVGALALFQMGSAVVQGVYHLGQLGKNIDVVGMLVLLVASALLPISCGNWRATYAHPYIHTRESLADDDGEGSGRRGDDRSPRGRRLSNGALPGHTTAPHQRVAVGQLRTVKDPPRSSRSRPTTAPAAAPAPGSSNSSTLAAAGAPSGIARQHLSPHMHSLGVQDAPEASPLLSGYGPTSHESKGGVVLAEDRAEAEVCLPAQRDVHAPALQLGSLTTREMLCTVNFWLLFVQFMVASGVSLSYLNNLGQLVVSLGGGHDGQVVFVSLFSVANAAGRLLMGYVPEQYLHSRGTPRTVFLTMTAVMLALASLATAYASVGHLYAISLLLGTAFGAHWSLLPAITSDLFGLKHFAANYTTLQFAPAAGSYLLATGLTGWLYDRAAAAHGDPHSCMGTDCFREAFLILSGLAGVSSLACCVATSRSRRAYQAVAQHLRQVDIAEGNAHSPEDQ